MNPRLVKISLSLVMLHMALGCAWHECFSDHHAGCHQDHAHSHSHNHHDHSNSLPHDPVDEPAKPLDCCQNDDCSWFANTRVIDQPNPGPVDFISIRKSAKFQLHQRYADRNFRGAQHHQRLALSVRAHLANCVLTI